MLTPELLTLLDDTDAALKTDGGGVRLHQVGALLRILTRWRTYGQAIVDAHDRNETRLAEMTGRSKRPA